jgi:hypothetical protein
MEANLRAAKAAGQLAEWSDPATVAHHMFSHHMAGFLAWGLGQIDLPTFRAHTLSGICHLLAGVTRGPFQAEVISTLRSTQEAAHAR